MPTTLDQDLQELIETYKTQRYEALAEYNDTLTKIEENFQKDLLELSKQDDLDEAEDVLKNFSQ